MLECTGMQRGLNQQDGRDEGHVAEIDRLPQAEKHKKVKDDHEQQNAVIHRVDMDGGAVLYVEFPFIPEYGGKLHHAFRADLEIKDIFHARSQIQGEQELGM